MLGHEQEVRNFRLVRGHFRYNLRALLADDARMLVVLRDPLRRTASALRHLKRDPDFHEMYQIAKDLSLRDMIRHPGIMSNQRDVQARFLCASTAPEDVSDHLARGRAENENPDAGDIEEPPEFQLAAERLETIDFVGMTEDLASLVSDMARQMRYHPPLYFPFINENPAHIDPLQGLDAEDLAIIREHNLVDLQVYDLARRLIARRGFEADMRRLVDSGTYRVAPGSFEIPMGGIMPGSGWYEAEHAEGEAYRWTGPGRYFTIDVPLRSDASYRLVLKFSDPRAAGPEHIDIEINDLPVGFELWPEEDLYSCEVVIDQSLLAAKRRLLPGARRRRRNRPIGSAGYPAARHHGAADRVHLSGTLKAATNRRRRPVDAAPHGVTLAGEAALH